MKHVYIIAEAGVNHNGRLDLALQLCDAAKAIGADAVKFQTWKTENIVTQAAQMAQYQRENLNDTENSQYKMLKKLELSYDDFVKVAKHCQEIGIDFMSTPDEEESLNFLLSSFEMKYLKIGSGELTNVPFLRKAAAMAKQPIIISTGMGTMGEIERAYKELTEHGAKEVILLHCTTNYPCPMEEVNLRAMLTLRDRFHCAVGYSDHTQGVEIPVAAVAMGAQVIEKHFTLDKTMEGPDHIASADIAEFKQMVDGIHRIELALGDGEKHPQQSELANRKIVRKSIVAAKPIEKGELLTEENLTTKRVGDGIPASDWDKVIGTRALHAYEIDEPIEIEQ